MSRTLAPISSSDMDCDLLMAADEDIFNDMNTNWLRGNINEPNSSLFSQLEYIPAAETELVSVYFTSCDDYLSHLKIRTNDEIYAAPVVKIEPVPKVFPQFQKQKKVEVETKPTRKRARATQRFAEEVESAKPDSPSGKSSNPNFRTECHRHLSVLPTATLWCVLNELNKLKEARHSLENGGRKLFPHQHKTTSQNAPTKCHACYARTMEEEVNFLLQQRNDGRENGATPACIRIAQETIQNVLHLPYIDRIFPNL